VGARAAWASCDAFALLDACPVRAPGLRVLEEERADERGALVTAPPRLGLVDGWRPDALVDSVTLHLVRLLDGATTLEQAVEAAAAAYDLDLDDVLPGALVAVRSMLEDRLLRLPHPTA